MVANVPFQHDLTAYHLSAFWWEKNSLLEDFLLAKHKDTNIPTMMEPFSSPAAWF
jgi:hypothetical protein